MAGDAVKLQKHKENADKAVADRDKQLQEQQEQKPNAAPTASGCEKKSRARCVRQKEPASKQTESKRK